MLKHLNFYAVALLTCALTACSAKTAQKAENSDILVNKHKFVDLGLPSGTLWAETNIGAAKATDKGDFYSWGETKPKADYSWTTYSWGHDFNNVTKYCASDKLTTLGKDDDVATVLWGAPCRMPTYKEFQELADSTNCTWTWKEIIVAKGDTARGYDIKSKRNGNAIFLPAGGAYNGSNYYSYGETGVYWSSTLSEEDSGNAYTLYFYFANFSFYRNDRTIGSSIRAVAPRKK